MQDKNTNIPTKSSFLATIKDLPEPQRTKTIAAVNELALLRFIERIAPRISAEQADQLEELQPQLIEPSSHQVDQKSQSAVMHWLAGAVPDYPSQLEVVLNELDSELTTKMAQAI